MNENLWNYFNLLNTVLVLGCIVLTLLIVEEKYVLNYFSIALSQIAFLCIGVSQVLIARRRHLYQKVPVEDDVEEEQA
jgi:hypothetical protein